TLFIGILILIISCFALCACGSDNTDDQDKSTDYVAKSGQCVISLPEDYDISFENENIDQATIFDKNLYNAKTVNGKPKKAGMRYYNVSRNEPFRILTPGGIISNKKQNRQSLVYWKLNDTLYKDGDNYYSENVFTCAVDTEITPVYYDFRKVGIIIYAVDENEDWKLPHDRLFDENGNIKEQDGVWYLHGVYDFEPNREYWKTNLTLESFDVAVAKKNVAVDYKKKIYTIKVKINKSNIFDSNKTIVISPLWKIEGHGYFAYGSRHVIPAENVDANIGIIHMFDIGEHGLDYSFVTDTEN
ncbi:MAG: hypothetical protein K2L88_00430, partial [Clostridiales bacterium]|nr:hypothetical protein [Clostridiales bacterium]